MSPSVVPESERAEQPALPRENQVAPGEAGSCSGAGRDGEDDGLKKDGIWPRIAKNKSFWVFADVLNCLQLVWVGIDADANAAGTRLAASPIFVLIDIIFILLFLGIFLVRVLVHKNPLDFRRSPRAVVDGILLFFLLLAVVIPGGGQVTGLLYAVQLGRALIFLMVIPEAHILLKGLWASLRSTFFCLLILLLGTYVFGILMTIATRRSGEREEEDNEEMFASVPGAMRSLILMGILPDWSDLMERLHEKGQGLGEAFFVLYVLFAFSVLVLLAATLCQVTGETCKVDKQVLVTQYFEQVLEKAAWDVCGVVASPAVVTKSQALQILSDPGTATAIEHAGVKPSQVASAKAGLDDTSNHESPSTMRISELAELICHYAFTEGDQLRLEGEVKALNARMARMEELLTRLASQTLPRDDNQA